MSFQTILDKTQCNTKKSSFIFPFPSFPPIQCCRVAIVGSLVENVVSCCVSRSLISIEWGDRGRFQKRYISFVHDCGNCLTHLQAIILGSKFTSQLSLCGTVSDFLNQFYIIWSCAMKNSLFCKTSIHFNSITTSLLVRCSKRQPTKFTPQCLLWFCQKLIARGLSNQIAGQQYL